MSMPPWMSGNASTNYSVLDIDPRWHVDLAVEMYLLSLGVKPHEIDHLRVLVSRVLKEHYHPAFMHTTAAMRRIYARCTARNRYKNGAGASVFGLTAFKSKFETRAKRAIVYELPVGRSGNAPAAYDPWAKLWVIKELDLDMPYR